MIYHEPFNQWLFQEAKMEVRTISKACVRPMYGNSVIEYGLMWYGTSIFKLKYLWFMVYIPDIYMCVYLVCIYIYI